VIATLNQRSLKYGVPGLVLQYGGAACFMGFPLFGLLAMVIGTVLLFIGIGLYLKAKGRSPAWVILIFIPVIGILFLAMLVDKSKPLSPGRA